MAPFKYHHVITAVCSEDVQKAPEELVAHLCTQIVSVNGKAVSRDWYDEQDLVNERYFQTKVFNWEEDPKPGFLPSGKSYKVLSRKVKDMKHARECSSRKDKADVMCHLIANVVLINGKKIVYEDVRLLDGLDGLWLERVFNGPPTSGTEK